MLDYFQKLNPPLYGSYIVDFACCQYVGGQTDHYSDLYIVINTCTSVMHYVYIGNILAIVAIAT